MDAASPARASDAPFAEDAFVIVGAGHRTPPPAPRKKSFRARLKGKPVLAVAVLAVIALGCLGAEGISNHDPAEFFLMHVNEAPNATFWFGTDSLGRDIYSSIWHGGRASLFIGLLSAAIMTLIGVAYGCLSGVASGAMDSAMMRVVELLQSVPVLLSLLLILSLMGKQNELTISLVIGATGWFGLSRIVRSEVRQIRNSEYILASRCMGAGFPFIMRKHLIPNFVSAIMFVVISGVSTSMAMEATLSFLGLGLPADVLSWGSMLALADRALLLKAWWVILIPGFFLVVTLLCITSIGHAFRKASNQGPSNL